MGDGGTRPRTVNLNLPEPAKGLWRAAGETIRDELRQITNGQDMYRIGGGSILAARWKHRQSHDIDLVVPTETPVAMLAQDNNPESTFEQRLRALGGEPGFYPHAKLWIVQFDGGKRKIDLWATTPLLEEPPCSSRVALDADPTTVSGLAWTSSRGAGRAVSSGTLVDVEIRVESRRPITLVAPALQRTLDA